MTETAAGKARFALGAVGAILVFDVLASLLCHVTGIPYGWSSPGTLALYAIIGITAGRRFGLRVATALTMLGGGADATLGWAISWAIGPGRQPTVLARPGVMAGIVATAGLLAGLVGLSAALVDRWIARRGQASLRG